MMKSTIHSLNTLLLLVAVMFTACDVEEFPLLEEGAKTGRIVLSSPEIQLFTEGGTRADGNIADYTYTLHSEEGSAHVLAEDSTITFTEGSAIIPAGKYTLTATSKTALDAAPWYQGTSAPFELSIGGTKDVEIDLGNPKNVEIVVTFESSFTTLYENYSVTIGNHSVSVNGNLYAMPDAEGKISYTIKGNAQQHSHVSDIPATGVTGRIDAVAGTSYQLNITAKTIDDLQIEFGGDHNGEFDTKEYRPLKQNNEAKATIYNNVYRHPRLEQWGVGG